LASAENDDATARMQVVEILRAYSAMQTYLPQPAFGIVNIDL
jgi:hypothetical protein